MKINVCDVLSETWEFYKTHFKKLAVFAVIGFFFSLLFVVSSNYASLFPQTLLSGLFLLLPGVIVVVFFPKFILAIPIYINSIFISENISFLESYKRTKGKYWAFAIYYLFIFLIFSIPIYALQNEPFWDIGLNFIMAIVSIPLFFVIPVISLEGNTKGFIKRSVMLMKGNFINLLILDVLSSSIFSMFYDILKKAYKGEVLTLIQIGIGYAIVRLFVSPFANVVAVIAYKKIAGDENIQKIDNIQKSQSFWIIIGSDLNEHTVSYKGMKFFGNVKLTIDGVLREFEPKVIKKIGWIVPFNVGDKELLLKIPFNGKCVDLAVDAVFFNDNSSASEILDLIAFETPDFTSEHAALRNKVRQADGSFLSMVVFTYVNIVLMSFKATVSFPFSAFVPTMIAGLATYGYEESGEIAVEFIVFAVILASVFLLLYILSKKQLAALFIALIFFILDTVVLLYFSIGDITSFLIDIGFHACVIFTLI